MLRPHVPIIDKAAYVDVSTLLDKQDRPVLIGITNYEQAPTIVRLQWPTLPHRIEGIPAVTARVEKEQLVISIPARQAAALFIGQ
jgi:kynurenine formamidase